MSVTCCCTRGAAVSRKLPEFICFFCEVDEHRLSEMAANNEYCKKHKSQWLLDRQDKGENSE